MRYFYDYEFVDTGKEIVPISIGMVSESGRKFYRVYAEWMQTASSLDLVRGNRWLMQNVVPHLPEVCRRAVYRGDVSLAFASASLPLVRPRWQLALELEAFIAEDGAARDDHELWAYYAAYDHVALAQTFGRMIDLPACIPMFTNDLQSVAAQLERTGRPAVRPEQGTEHHALADAEWDLAFWKNLVKAAGLLVSDVAHGGVTPPASVVSDATIAALWERYAAVGPDDGLGAEQEKELEAWYARYTPPGDEEDGEEPLPV